MSHGYPDFLSDDHPETLIVYGIVSDPKTVVASVDRQRLDGAYELTNRYAIVSPASPGLRLSSLGWIDISIDQMAQVGSTADLFHLCRERIIARSSPFSKLIRLFLDRYLESALTLLEAHKDDLGAVATDDEIFDYRDWIFSAWLPLPQAQVLLPTRFDSPEPAFAELDIAFSLPGQLVGVQIDGASTPIKSRRRKLDYLVDNHPQLSLVRVPKSRLEDEMLVQELFPESFAGFWHGLSLPLGPCAPPVLLEGR